MSRSCRSLPFLIYHLNCPFHSSFPSIDEALYIPSQTARLYLHSFFILTIAIMQFILSISTLLLATSVIAAPSIKHIKPAPIIQLAKRIEARQAPGVSTLPNIISGLSLTPASAAPAPCHSSTFCYQKITHGNENVIPSENKYCSNLEYYIKNPPKHCNRPLSNVSSVCNCLQAPTPSASSTIAPAAITTSPTPTPTPSVCNQKGNLKDGVDAAYTVRDVNTLDDCLDMCRQQADCKSGGVWTRNDGMQSCDLFTRDAVSAFTVEDDGDYVYGDGSCNRNVPMPAMAF